MGRPRKRQNGEEEIQSQGNNVSNVGELGYGEPSVIPLDLSLGSKDENMLAEEFCSNAVHSSNNYGTSGYVTNGLETNQLGSNEVIVDEDMSLDNGQETNDLYNGNFGFDFSQDLESSGIPSFSNWVASADSSSIPSQSGGSPIQSQASLHSTATSVTLFPNDAGVPGCACLPNLYTALASFQSAPPPSFPYTMGVLKKAANLGRDVVRCQNCVKTNNLALQNSMMLGTLLNLVIGEYSKLLKYIDQRSCTEDKIAFRMADHSPALMGLHTGTPDCPMAINIDLSGPEWGMLAKKAIKQELIGDSENSKSLVNLTQEMKTRQLSWHAEFCEGSDQPPEAHAVNKHDNGKNDCLCVQVVYINSLLISIEELRL